MTVYNASVIDDGGENATFNDDMTITRTVTNVPASDTLATAWMTIKERITDTDANALLQLSITSVESGDGQITDTGADTEGSITFTISGTDFDNMVSGRSYPYDIQVKTTAGVISTIEHGKIRMEPEVTVATS